ncbi:MAG: DUF4198 domain-containing protein [Bacteroidota bacterium]
MKLNKASLPKKYHPLFRTFYLLLVILVFSSHDLYLKMESYLLQPNQKATLNLYNGTFEKSENIITRDRMLDASFVALGKRIAIQPNAWQDQDSTITQLSFNTGEAGTYVVGVSTKARNIELTADKFNDYLKHDGVLDMLKAREKNNVLDHDAVESYQKHVKAIYQVGDVKTDDWKTVLGYPIEFVPETNPYEKYSGETLTVKLLLDGKPLPNQLVYADYIPTAHGHKHTDHGHHHDGDGHSHQHGDNGHSHDHDGHKHSHDHSHDHDAHHHHEDSEVTKGHTHTSGQQLRTDAQGLVSVKLPEDGIYYLRTIHMVNLEEDETLTHESKWATLTFEVTHAHGTDTHTHDHHDHEEGLATWIFILVSVLVIGALFFIFRKKN